MLLERLGRRGHAGSLARSVGTIVERQRGWQVLGWSAGATAGRVAEQTRIEMACMQSLPVPHRYGMDGDARFHFMGLTVFGTRES